MVHRNLKRKLSAYIDKTSIFLFIIYAVRSGSNAASHWFKFYEYEIVRVVSDESGVCSIYWQWSVMTRYIRGAIHRSYVTLHFPCVAVFPSWNMLMYEIPCNQVDVEVTTMPPLIYETLMKLLGYVGKAHNLDALA